MLSDATRWMPPPPCIAPRSIHCRRGARLRRRRAEDAGARSAVAVTALGAVRIGGDRVGIAGADADRADHDLARFAPGGGAVRRDDAQVAHAAHAARCGSARLRPPLLRPRQPHPRRPPHRLRPPLPARRRPRPVQRVLRVQPLRRVPQARRDRQALPARQDQQALPRRRDLQDRLVQQDRQVRPDPARPGRRPAESRRELWRRWNASWIPPIQSLFSMLHRTSLFVKGAGAASSVKKPFTASFRAGLLAMTRRRVFLVEARNELFDGE